LKCVVYGSRCSNWNNYVWNSNWNIGSRAACEDNHFGYMHSLQVTAAVVRPDNVVRLSILLRRIHSLVCKIVSSGISKAKDNILKDPSLGKKYKNLFNRTTDINNLRDAYCKTVRGGNRYTYGHLHFKENIEANIMLLKNRVESGSYSPGDYREFKVYEPKERIIKALPFRDRVLQHAIYNIIEPIFEPIFYSCSYACRKNKGTHKGVKDVQATMRRLHDSGTVYYLKMDFSKYFHSIDTTVLFMEIKKKITDNRVVALMKMFTNEHKGIPIGNLLSQLYANIYGHIFDRFVKTKLKAKHYFRYMDDTVILSNNRDELKRWQQIIHRFIGIYMKLKFSKWHISSLSKPLNFLGYRITERYKLIRKDSVIRAKRKIKTYTRSKDENRLKMFLASWLGHVKYANSYNLIHFIQKEIKHGNSQ